MAAMLTMTLVMKIARAVANFVPSAVSKTPKDVLRAKTTRDDTMMPKMPMPEIGLAEVPIKPAM